MKRINSNDVFGPGILNIFTDASLRTLSNKEQVGCAGTILFLDKKAVREKYQIIRNTTSNNSEIKAIRLGITEAIRLRQQMYVHTIRLFSDSQISIFGIRERIFTWNNKNGYLYGYGNVKIKNQDIMLQIVNTIVENNMPIEFYHQSGHINVENIKDVIEATHVFGASNGIRQEIDYEFIKNISRINDRVDKVSRKLLKGIEEKDFHDNRYKDGLTFFYNNFDSKKYRKLIQN